MTCNESIEYLDRQLEKGMIVYSKDRYNNEMYINVGIGKVKEILRNIGI